MNLRNVLIALVLLGVLGWWYSPHSPRVPAPPKHAGTATDAGCPLPPLVARGQPPLQSNAPASMAPFRLHEATLQPLAGFSVEARVLSREVYGFGREADYSPSDLALRWGRRGDEALVERRDIALPAA